MVDPDGRVLREMLERLNADDRGSVMGLLRGLEAGSLAGLGPAVGAFRRDVEAGSREPDIEGARALVTLLEQHPVFESSVRVAIGLPVIGPVTPETEEARREAADVLLTGGLVLAWLPDVSEAHVSALVQTAFGADAMSVVLRHVVLGKPAPDADGLWTIPIKLLDLRSVAARGCVLGIMHALGELGRAAAAEQEAAETARERRVWATGISSLTPSVGCAGTQVTIDGTGFGAVQPADTTVWFPRRGGGCSQAAVVSWSAAGTAVVVTAPIDVGVGYVGFAHTPPAGVAPHGSTLAEAVDGVAGEMESCVGMPAFSAAQRLRDHGVHAFGPAAACPGGLPRDENLFRGGRPIVKSFAANAAQLRAGDGLDLSWTVENATTVEIVPIRVNGLRNELPAVPAPLATTNGTYHVPSIPGRWIWEGRYELRAWNACTPPGNPETASVKVSMGLRRPTGFLWGAAASAYQVEGAITNNDWHLFTTNSTIRQRVHDLAAYKDPATDFQLAPAGEAIQHGQTRALVADLTRLKLLGLNAYRFSVEWARVQPTATTWDNAAINYYVQLVRQLLTLGIEPIVTLSHLSMPSWTLVPPVKTQPSLPGLPDIADDSDPAYQASMKGWENPAVVAAWIDFVKIIVARLSAEGVRFWIPLNEPIGSVIVVGYIGGVWPPGFSADAKRAKTVYWNLLRAHVQAFDAIRAIDPSALIGIAHAVIFFKPAPGGVGGANVAAANQQHYFYTQHFLDAVTSGNVDINFAHRPRDRLIQDSAAFFGIATDDWMPKLDFVGVNYYRAAYASQSLPANLAGVGFIGGDLDDHVASSITNDLGWEIFPDGLSSLLIGFSRDYGLPILITENGIAEREDARRSAYLVAHVDQIRQAVDAGVNVLGYLHWSIADNWELAYAYDKRARFGLYRVNRGLRDSYGHFARAITPGALALRYVVEGDGTLADRVRRASDRFGRYDGPGSMLTPPSKSPGALWQGTVDGREFALYLTKLSPTGAPSRLAGMVFDGASRRWVRLAEVTFQPATQTIAFFHPAEAGLAEREYSGTLAGDDFTGDFVEAATVHTWQATRVWLDGVWPATGFSQLLVFAGTNQWEAALPAGTAARWLAKSYDAGQAEGWTRFAATRFDGTNLKLWLTDEAALGAPDLTGTVTGQAMQGTVAGTTWTATRADDETLI
jgi:beta-glucosidase/6-phospho-beta-glucosidase/beta-galactosidase